MSGGARSARWTPCFRAEIVCQQRRGHLQLLSRTPAVQDAQSVWLLLLMCAGPSANDILRNLPPFRGVRFRPEP